MAADKYFADAAGQITEKSANQTSAGAGDAGRIIALNASGLVDGTMLNVASVPGSNFLKNGGFKIDQRVNSATSVLNNTYSLDVWKILTQSASVQVTQQANQENGSPYSIRLLQNQASAQRMGVIQPVEARDCVELRGKTVTLSARVRVSNSQAVRYAILEWTGTADAPTTNVVNDWTSAAYTASNFFLAANLTITAVGSITPSANTWTPITILTGTISSSLNNLLVFFWTEGTAAQNVTLSIGQAKLEIGSYATQFVNTPFTAELIQLQRYFEKSFGYTVAPASATGVDAGSYETSAVTAGATTVRFPSTTFEVEKISSPTLTFYNTNNAGSQATDNTDGGDCTGTAIVSQGTRGFSLNATGPAGMTVGARITIHWTADSGL